MSQASHQAPPAPPTQPTAIRQAAFQNHYLVAAILFLGIALQLVRILQVQSPQGDSPFFSANDRSRWCTIAALAINGSYEIDDVLQIRDPKTRRRTWNSIDVVRHRGRDGQQHFYSSKPPLLPTIYTGVYLLVKRTTGLSLMQNTFSVAKIMLILVNLLPLAGLWYLLAGQVKRQHENNLWASLILTSFLVFGTFLSTFAVTLNNHLPAAISVGVSLWCLERIGLQGKRQWYLFGLCGVATSFAVANELPALSWLVAVGVLLGMIDWRRTLFIYSPALLPVAIAFFATNYAAHGVLRPAYAHRDLGEKLFEIPIPQDTPLSDLPIRSVAQACAERGMTISLNSEIRPARRAGIFELWDPTSEQRLALRQSSPNSMGIYEWGDWYDYPGSYWVEGRKQGVDRGEPSSLIYAFHCLLGHHGIFSLTPFWLVSIAGAYCVWQQRTRSPLNPQLWLMLAILGTSLVCLAFYLARPLEDRNYGGVSSGFRWVFWLTPLWFWLAVQGMGFIRSNWQRRAVEIALLISIFSANYAWSNPWISPWIMKWWEDWGWISYA
jgi:hypothetical protein